MRLAAAILILVAHVAVCAQTSIPASQNPLRVRALTIVSDDLPQPDRERVVQSLQGQTYIPNEFEERLRTRLRDLGYYNAQVEGAAVSATHIEKSGENADISVHVEPGVQYRFGLIGFQHVTIFPPDQIRIQFPIRTGGLYNATGIGYGLEKLRMLYEQKGYINFGAIPKISIDEAHHIVDLTIDIDEGKPYVFGHLLLEGIEPHARAGTALIDSWANLQGKTYNPELLKDWLASNWPGGAEAMKRVKALQDAEARQVNICLRYP